MAFLGSFMQYLVIFVFLAAISVVGVVFGKILRNRKDEKDLGEK